MKMKEKVKGHCWLVVSGFVTLVSVVVGVWLLVLSYRQSSPYAQVLEAGAGVDQSNDMEGYDAAVTLRDVERGSLPEGVACGWGHYVSFLDDLEPQKLENPELRLEEPITFYEFVISVRNDTDEVFSGLNFRFDAGIKDGEDHVVADNMTLIPELLYGDKVMRMPFDIDGNGVPFCFEMMDGSPIFLDDGNGETTYPWKIETTQGMTADEMEAESLQQVKNWQEKGIELDVPPGETWTLSMNFAIVRVKDVKIETLMSARDVSGSEIVLCSPRGGDIVHVESEIDSSALVECQTLWPMLKGKAELVSGSVRMNGKRVPDFEIDSTDSATDMTHYKDVDLSEYTSGHLRLEYDMRLKPGEKPEAVAFITCIRDERGSNLASTTVTAINYVCSLRDFWVACGYCCVVVVVCVVMIVILNKRKEK